MLEQPSWWLHLAQSPGFGCLCCTSGTLHVLSVSGMLFAWHGMLPSHSHDIKGSHVPQGL